MNDQRPKRFWPCSADSSRNVGPSPRSFRNADDRASRSQRRTRVARPGRGCLQGRRGRGVSSSVGLDASTRGGSSGSYSASAAAIEHLARRPRSSQPAAAQQPPSEVVEDVSAASLVDALVGLLACGAPRPPRPPAPPCTFSPIRGGSASKALTVLSRSPRGARQAPRPRLERLRSSAGSTSCRARRLELAAVKKHVRSPV